MNELKHTNGVLDTTYIINESGHFAYTIEHTTYQIPHVTHKFAHSINESKHKTYTIGYIVNRFGHSAKIFGCNMNYYQHMTYWNHFCPWNNFTDGTPYYIVEASPSIWMELSPQFLIK